MSRERGESPQYEAQYEHRQDAGGRPGGEQAEHESQGPYLGSAPGMGELSARFIPPTAEQWRNPVGPIREFVVRMAEIEDEYGGGDDEFGSRFWEEHAALRWLAQQLGAHTIFDYAALAESWGAAFQRPDREQSK